MTDYRPTTLSIPLRSPLLARSVFRNSLRGGAFPSDPDNVSPVEDEDYVAPASPTSTIDLSPSQDVHGFRDIPVPADEMASLAAVTGNPARPAPTGVTPSNAQTTSTTSTAPVVPPPDTTLQNVPGMPISYYHSVHQPTNFGGERGENVEKFLVALKLSFLGLSTQIPNVIEREQIKLDILESYLVGRAYDYWVSLNPTHKATFDLASTALKRKFPRPNYEVTRWNVRIKAQAEMNSLTQGDMTTEEYVEKANELYDTLGEEYALALSTKFVDGINDRAVQVHVDTQTRGNYTSFLNVIQAYTIATTSIRRQEMANRKANVKEPK